MVDPSNDLWVEEEAHLRLAVEVDPKVINNGKEEVEVGEGLNNNNKEDLHETRLQATGAVSAPHNSRDLPNSSKGTGVDAADRSNGLHSNKAEATGAVVAVPSKISTAGEEGLNNDLHSNKAGATGAVAADHPNNISSSRVGHRGTTAGVIRTASKGVDIRSKGVAIKIEAGNRVVDRKIADTAGDMVPETMVAWIKKIGTRKALANR